jgi:hypothetical protein
MYGERHSVSLTTAADETATGYTPVVTGRIMQIIYEKTDFADGVGFTITAEATGETIWTEAAVNASTWRAPRQATHSTAGVAALRAAGGTAVLDYIVLANDRVKFAIANGGQAKSGTFQVVVG